MNNEFQVTDESTSQIQMLVDAMNANNASNPSTPYSGFEITATRRKYHLLNSILTNGQRSAWFLIDRNTLDVFKADGYGRAGRKVGTVISIMEEYVRGTLSRLRNA